MSDVNSFLNRIVLGDCIEVMRQLPNESIDLVVADPPFLVNLKDRAGRSYRNDNPNDAGWLMPAFSEVYRVLKPDSFCICFYGWMFAEKFLRAWNAAGFFPCAQFIWIKRYASHVKYTRAEHQAAYLLKKGEPDRPQNPPSDVRYEWEHTGNRLHPTQMPIEAVVPLIETYSRKGEIVLDPFAGSGTTIVAAHRLGRTPIGIEIDTTYHRTACERLRREQEG